MDRLLIINADDCGINSSRTHGIFEAVEFGAVTSVTVIPNETDSQTAARHARERDVPAGLHLNLTEGFPLSKPEDVSTLIMGNGEFYEPGKLRQLLSEGAIDRAHLEREIRAQCEWLLDEYGQPTHLDGHHHIHIHPFIVQVLLPILDRYAINFVRIPAEDPLPPFGYVITEEEVAKARTITAQANEARKLFEANHIRSTDHFRGLTLAGNASQKNLRHILNRLPEGSTELMVHPGSMAAYGTPFDLDPQRQTELHMVLNPEVRALCAEKKIRLGSFRDLL